MTVNKMEQELAMLYGKLMEHWLLFLGSRRGRKRQEVGTELKEVKVGYVI
jgi:hypothetical protein